MNKVKTGCLVSGKIFFDVNKDIVTGIVIKYFDNMDMAKIRIVEGNKKGTKIWVLNPKYIASPETTMRLTDL